MGIALNMSQWNFWLVPQNVSYWMLILADQNKPWVWYAPTLPRHPDPSHSWYIDKLLEKGISFAGCDQGEVAWIAQKRRPLYKIL